jgi:hypothetical protein
MTAEDEVMEELERTRELLNAERTGVGLQEGQPEWSPESLGARAGLGFTASDPDLRVSVFVFDEWGGGGEAGNRLQEELSNDPGVYAAVGTNGRLLFVGHTRVDGPEGTGAKYRLADLLSAFSGRE